MDGGVGTIADEGRLVGLGVGGRAVAGDGLGAVNVSGVGEAARAGEGAAAKGDGVTGVTAATGLAMADAGDGAGPDSPFGTRFGTRPAMSSRESTTSTAAVKPPSTNNAPTSAKIAPHCRRRSGRVKVPSGRSGRPDATPLRVVGHGGIGRGQVDASSESRGGGWRRSPEVGAGPGGAIGPKSSPGPPPQ
jgi:hypothetical protein